jgi:hypothetical protein
VFKVGTISAWVMADLGQIKRTTGVGRGKTGEKG